ncbi:MAG TPA: metalloregulator ArsR/SmtB family transcription factor [bacterium]|nr:metalloregulator ArsR/SmtB family transcription factor [bacterium]HPP87244.1 metalloregulator ArsR/SmtB family transcription factor [bacterium]
MLENEIRVIKLFKILSNPTRYKIVKLLAYNNTLSSGEIKKYVNKNHSAVSQHLRLLKNLDVVQYFMKGNEIIYKLKKNKISHFIAELEKYYLRK